MQVQSMLLHDNVLNFTQQHSAVVTVQWLQSVVSSVTILVSSLLAGGGGDESKGRAPVVGSYGGVLMVTCHSNQLCQYPPSLPLPSCYDSVWVWCSINQEISIFCCPTMLLCIFKSEVCHQKFSSAFGLLLIFLSSLIQTLTPIPPPNNALLANGHVRSW